VNPAQQIGFPAISTPSRQRLPMGGSRKMLAGYFLLMIGFLPFGGFHIIGES
jgi:hypothetical protein